MYFVGIDPGQTGGLGVLDQAGGFVAAHRWDRQEPVRLFNLLSLIKDQVINIYIESVRVFPQKKAGFINQNQGLLVNSGIWQGWFIALGLPWVSVHPTTWQGAFQLTNWQARLKKNPAGLTPLIKARQLWPAAGLELKADDGKAVGLLLARFAFEDHLKGIDRGLIQAQARASLKVIKANLRKAKKDQGVLSWEETKAPSRARK